MFLYWRDCVRELFSVLMSVYYKEKAEYFELSLKSILIEQSVKPNEVVLVCDGHLTDELNYVIEKYVEKFPNILKVYRLETNQGLGRALNYGLEQCSYPLVARADSDDICTKNRFEVQLDYMKCNPTVAVVGSNIAEFDCDIDKICSIKKMPTMHSELIKLAKIRNPLNHMAVMFRKKDILAVGSYQHIPWVEDYYLWVRMISAGKKIANINQVLVYARVGNGMVERRGNKEYIESWKKLNMYMLKNQMISKFEKIRNMVMIKVFVYMPNGLKKFAYKNVLRKSGV